MKQTRRNFLHISVNSMIAAGLSTLLPGCSKEKTTQSEHKDAGSSTADASHETPKATALKESPKPSAATTSPGRASLPKAKGPRVVIIGGGVSGLTLAKYLKQHKPSFDIVLVEKNVMYMSCFATALWYADKVPMSFLASHSYFDAARMGDYWYFQASCTGLDRDAKKVITDQGEIAYDYAVFAPGIDYDYESIGVGDIEAQMLLDQNYPAGFHRPAEYITIKNKIHRFKGGVFVQTVPSGNYRCFASPFERACVMAALFKQNNIKGKVLLLDASPEIRIKRDGFNAAFTELYKDYIEYVPSVTITGVDPEKKVVQTDFDEYGFDDACIYPSVRGAKLLETCNIMDPGSLQKEARIDPLRNHLPDDESVFVIGDSRPMPFSKSANTAYTEAKYIARQIAAMADGKTVAWQSPTTMCFSIVNLEPLQGISVQTDYQYNKDNEAFEFARSSADEQRDNAKAKEVKHWTQSIHQDLFG